MSTSNVVRLGEYRGRREQRLRQTLALYSADPERSAVADRLAGALTLLAADRAAVVWVDEYGPGLVHVYALLDLAHDQPRRRFASGPLKAAWEDGIPGLLDEPELNGELSLYSERPRSRAVVSLGSDGTRAWFMQVDSKGPRAPLGLDAAEFLMFLAGECAAVLLHQDLRDVMNRPGLASERLRRERFAGWPILRDLEGREESDQADRRISCRFMVSRVVLGLVEDDFAADPETLGQQVEGVRREMRSGSSMPKEDRELELWIRALDRAERVDLPGLAAATLELANEVENQGHLHGARELHRCAYEVAAAAGSGKMVVDALRFHGRTCRKLGEIEAAEYWSDRADDVARELEDPGLRAEILTGRANLKRQLGNFPAARELLTVQEEAARASGDPALLAQCHHGWMALEGEAGNWREAVVRGWQAFGLYEERLDQLLALGDLGWFLVDSGSLPSAENAFSVVIEQDKHAAIRVGALEGMVRIAALKKDQVAFNRWEALADAEAENAERAFALGLKLYRATSYLELGMTTEAEACLRLARDGAEQLSLNSVYFEAKKLLDELEETEASLQSSREAAGGGSLEESADAEVVGILQGLADLRKGVGTLGPV